MMFPLFQNKEKFSLGKFSASQFASGKFHARV